jgi:hypothetical protein
VQGFDSWLREPLTKRGVTVERVGNPATWDKVRAGARPLTRIIEKTKRSQSLKKKGGSVLLRRDQAKLGQLSVGVDNLNDAARLALDPTFRLIGSKKIWERGAALTSRLQSFETTLLMQADSLAGLATLNRELIARADAIAPPRRVVLDLDSTEIPVHGQQEQSAYNGHFASTCYHPLLLFDRESDCLAAKLRPGNAHSAEGWAELLLPQIKLARRQRTRGTSCVQTGS